MLLLMTLISWGDMVVSDYVQPAKMPQRGVLPFDICYLGNATYDNWMSFILTLGVHYTGKITTTRFLLSFRIGQRAL